MLNKIVGFKEAWGLRSKLIINLFIFIIGVAWLGYLFTLFENLELQELKYHEKKISQMEQKSIANKVAIDLKIRINESRSKKFDSVLIKLGNISSLEYIADSLKGAYSFVVNANEFFIPFNDEIDVDAELDKIQLEIEDRKGFLNSVMKKINNEKFMANAPQKVVDMEMKKKSDAENQIKVLESKLESLRV